MAADTQALTGRIRTAPAALVHSEILEPQFRHEVRHLLPWYVHCEQVLLLEYLRMGLLDTPQAADIAGILHALDGSALTADPDANMSDTAFAVEAHVRDRLAAPVPAWHVDRSRNDLQACVQLQYGRVLMRDAADALLDCVQAVHRAARRNLDALMPGYTHLQPAQVMTPGFYLAGLSGQLIHTLHRLLAVYDGCDLSPLGAGAMTGQELDWDQERMAALLGFAAADPHPLSAVASRAWVLEASAECALAGVALSRFVTDLMAWGGGAYQFLDLPDELSGISSAMPQKKNFPVLERIRGRTAHLISGFLDVATAQRATPFANSVEVSKEGSTRLPELFGTLESVLRLLGVVVDHAEFQRDRMRRACEREYLGGFSLANALALSCGIPWRTAQVIAGEYIVEAVEHGLAPLPGDPALLARIAAGRGHDTSGVDLAALLARVFDPEYGLRSRQAAGSARPDAVAALLDRQAAEAEALRARWRERRERVQAAVRDVDDALDLAGGPAPAGSVPR
jgi:argininosuccinate lyase